jgi:hypothetical protein
LWREKKLSLPFLRGKLPIHLPFLKGGEEGLEIISPNPSLKKGGEKDFKGEVRRD